MLFNFGSRNVNVQYNNVVSMCLLFKQLNFGNNKVEKVKLMMLAP